MRTDLAGLLREYFHDLMTVRNSDTIQIGDKNYVWPGKWPAKAAEMLRSDLAAAGVAYQDEQERFLDFSRPGKPTDNAFIESFNELITAEHGNDGIRFEFRTCFTTS